MLELPFKLKNIVFKLLNLLANTNMSDRSFFVFVSLFFYPKSQKYWKIRMWQMLYGYIRERALTLNGSEARDQCRAAGRAGVGAIEASSLVHSWRGLNCDFMLKIC